MQKLLSQQAKWDRLADSWYDAGPPSTPSSDDIERYTLALREVHPSTAVVLGCTPSLRFLLGTYFENPPKIYVVDFSTKMYERTTALLAPTWPEEFVHADWCNDWPPVQSAELVFGDRALDNVPIEERRSFFCSVRKHMVRDGIFVNHTALRSLSLERQSVARIVGYWCDKWRRSLESMHGCIDGLWDDLLTLSARPSLNGASVSLRPILQEVNAAYAATDYPSTATHIVSKMMERYASTLDAEWFTQTFYQVRETAQEWFDVAGVAYSQDYAASDHHPFLVMRAG